jgi:alanine dehydrogenase
LPYVLQLATHGWRNVAQADPGVAEGVNINHGRVTNQAVASTYGLRFDPLYSRPASLAAPVA